MAAALAKPAPLLYVPLKDYDEFSLWSNDPDKMKLPTYFTPHPRDPSQDMTLAAEYNIPGLKPVIVKRDDTTGNTYLLKDDKNECYLWNETDVQLWRFKSKQELDQIVDIVQTDSYSGEDLVRQFRVQSGRGQAAAAAA